MTDKKDLFAEPTAAERAAQREERYADIIARLGKLEAAQRDTAYYQQRVEDLHVDMERALAATRTFNARLEALEKTAEAPCVCHQQLEDLREDLADMMSGETRLWAAVDLTRQELKLAQVPDEAGTTQEYAPAALLGMAPAPDPQAGGPEPAPPAAPAALEVPA